MASDRLTMLQWHSEVCGKHKLENMKLWSGSEGVGWVRMCVGWVRMCGGWVRRCGTGQKVQRVDEKLWGGSEGVGMGEKYRG